MHRAYPLLAKITMSIENCPKTTRIAAFCGMALLSMMMPFACALHASSPALTNASWSSGQFQFTLRGQTNVSYIIEFSTDLTTWTPVLTNTEPFWTRTIIVPAASSRGFWRVSRVPGPLFVNAIAARGIVNLGTNINVIVDGFDSADPNYSTNGQHDPTKRKDGGDVASALTTAGAITVGNAKIAGMVWTGPGGNITL